MDQFVGETDPTLPRNNFCEILLNALRFRGFGELESAAEAEHVRVDHDSFGKTVSDSQNNVARLTGNSREAQQFVQRFRDLASKLLDQLLGGPGNRLSLVVIKAGRSNLFFDLDQRGPREIFRSGKFFEEPGCHHVYPCIRALRRENGSHEKFPGILVMQRTFSTGISALQDVENLSNPLGR